MSADVPAEAAAPAPQAPIRRRQLGGVPLRAWFLGIAASVGVPVISIYSTQIIGASRIDFGYLPLIVLLITFIFTAGINALFKTLTPRRALSKTELVVLFTMSLASTTVATAGLTSYLIPTLSTPYYFATPENRYGELFFDHIPAWICPQPGSNAMVWFYEGLPAGARIPWEVWIVPIAWWFSLVMAVTFVCIAIVTVLRKQWVEHERLLFPLTEVPIELVHDADTPSRRAPSMLHSRVFWVGFAAAALIYGWNIVNHFEPAWPKIPVGELRGNAFQISRHFPPISMHISLPIMAVCFLAPLQVLMSFWVFHLFAIGQVGVYNQLGFAIGPADPFSSYHATIGWQTWGAFCVFVLWGLWMARGHLRTVWRKAWRNDPTVDDSDEILPYRVAVWGGLVAFVYVATWLHASGMSADVLALFLFATFVIYIGITRVVIEGGLTLTKSPIIPQPFTMYTLGATHISHTSFTALAFSYGWICDVWAISMPAIAHAARLADWVNVHKRTIAWACLLSVAVAIPVSACYTLAIGYRDGAYNYDAWTFHGLRGVAFDNVAAKINNARGPDWHRLAFMAGGAALMSLLTYMRYRFSWWQLHPIGYTSANSMAVQMSVGTIFFAWLLKFLIVKLGGGAFYLRAKPFFYGVLIGGVTLCGISLVLDAIWFPLEGHQIYF